ncbi:protein translocase subunit SecF [Tessaracoccus antarcticus]|uniref:Protein-export membrane protein SecF n=2 Tax=Tessaracoccus antarcticus TaxID=2479848 RepID=A0A3M0G2F4_9ACTN|nr:protein translocase subunit SecF [Tessaracoccus antarcticus]RMB58758.1 protein translocase subunit SecF [Tessaracoccus antarcticus]
MMSTTKLGLAHRLYTGKVSYDFIKNRKLWYAISAILLTVSILALVIRGLTLGIEFKGGTDFQAPTQVTASTVDDVRSAVDNFEVPDLGAQVFSIGTDAVRIQTRVLTPEETSTVRAAIAELTGAPPADVTYNAIGASWGQQVSQQAGIALVVFVVLVMLLIWVWFRDWKMSVAAIVALAHDLVITVGIYALVGFTVTPATVIGVLTILGYSLYDTVVVFDKIKENVAGLSDSNKTYSQAANLGVNQVLVRSINTTIIGVLPVASLLIAGSVLSSGPLQDLGLALFIGMIAGAYSSIFIATPVLSTLKEREPAQVEHRATLARRIERATAKSMRRSDDVVLEDGDAVAVTSTGGVRSQPRAASSRADRRKRPGTR